MLNVPLLSPILFWSTFLNVNSKTGDISPWTGNNSDMYLFISVNTDSFNNWVFPTFGMFDCSLIEKNYLVHDKVPKFFATSKN